MNLCMKEEYQDINLIKIYENYVRTRKNFSTKRCPVPAYLTCNPFGCNGGFTGYGYGYNDGCGCGC